MQCEQPSMPVDHNTLQKSTRGLRRDKELQYLAGQNGSLFYEVWMLNESARKWGNTPAGVEHNFATECFLLHFRNVRDFLYPPRESWTNPRYFDDVIAFDFCTKWLAISDDWIECSPDERTRINKLLAHVSYSRPQLDHAWPVLKMLAAIRTEFCKFVSQLAPDRTCWFDAYDA